MVTLPMLLMDGMIKTKATSDAPDYGMGDDDEVSYESAY
jgi:hypothetical protein